MQRRVKQETLKDEEPQKSDRINVVKTDQVGMEQEPRVHYGSESQIAASDS